jgi:hypothetical protein
MSTSIVWPTTLPQLFSEDGFTETSPNTTVATSMDVGPKKIRRRSTVGVRIFSGKMLLTQEQVTIFDGFYKTTTQSGSLSFIFSHPRTAVSTEMWFAAGETPSSSGASGNNAWVSFKLEMLG